MARLSTIPFAGRAHSNGKHAHQCTKAGAAHEAAYEAAANAAIEAKGREANSERDTRQARCFELAAQ